MFTVVSMYFNIMKTCLYNFDPLKPHFYLGKVGFIGEYIIFPISAQNIDFQEGGSNEYPPRRGNFLYMA